MPQIINRTEERVHIDNIQPHPANPNDGDVAAIAESIEQNGFYGRIVVRDSTGKILAGEHRWRAAQEVGLSEVPIERVECDDETAMRILLADNRTAEKAEREPEPLADLLQELEQTDDGLEGTGYMGDDLDELLDDLGRIPGNDVDDPGAETSRAEELQEEWGTERGQLWRIGDHRLLCGDATDEGDVDRLLDGVGIQVAITSPPYAEQREYDSDSDFDPIPPDEYVDWFFSVSELIRPRLANGGSWFVNIKPNAEGLDRSLYVLDLVVAHAREWGWHFSEEYCWERSGIPQQVNRRFKNQFEPVYHFTLGEWDFYPERMKVKSDSVPIPHGKGEAGDTNAAKRQGKVSAVYDNDTAPGKAYPGNRLPTFQGTHDAVGHPAAFPVGLPDWFIRAFSNTGEAIYDPFLGSGSSILAAEQNDRVGYGMEISNDYCAVILERCSEAGLECELIE